VDPQPLIVQCALAAPLTLGLAVHTWMRRDGSPLHRTLVAVLLSVVLWLCSLLLKSVAVDPAWRTLGLHLEYLSMMLMPVLYVTTMGYLARLPLFEQSRAAVVSLSSVFAVFFVAYLTDGIHHQFFTDRDLALAGARPDQYGGPLFWSLQLWLLVCDLLGIGLSVSLAWRGRTPAERQRGWMVLAAVLCPVLAHMVYLLDLLPIDYSLAPATLGVTALLFVQGVHRFGLLVDQPVVRQDVIEHIHDGLVLADRAGLVVDANVAAEAVLGRTRDEMVGEPLEHVLAALDAEDDLGARIGALPLDGGRLSGELRTRSGRHIEFSAGAVSALGSQPAGRFVTLRDRSDQRRNERLLRERQKLESVGILAAGVAHEVNNPLAYVRANLLHLSSLAPTLEKAITGADASERSELLEIPEILGDSLEGLDRIARIVDSLLRFSRVPDEERRPVQVNAVVEEALRLSALHRDQGIRVERRLAPDLPPAMGSYERLVQVVLNLMLNARQALADRGEGQIVAATSLEGDSVVLRVQDDGPGIPPEIEPRIFDPFFTTRAPGRGTGLGLSIAFDIVREHGGTLELEHLPVGTGFAIHLPAADPA